MTARSLETKPTFATENAFAFVEARGPQTIAWEAEQTKHTIDLLHAHPQFESIVSHVKEFFAKRELKQAIEVRGKVTFSIEQLPSSDEMAIFRDSPGQSRVVLFQTSKEEAARRVQIDFMSVSPLGRWIAVGTSKAGGEEVTVRVIDARTGADHGDRCEDLRISELQWFPDDTGFIFLRGRGRAERGVALRDQMKDLSLAWHKVGSPPGADVEIVGSGAPGKRISRELDYLQTTISPDGQYVVLTITHGITPEMEVFTKKTETLTNFDVDWTRFYSAKDHVTSVAIRNDSLLAVRALDNGGAVLEETSFQHPSTHSAIYNSTFPVERVYVVGGETYLVQVHVSMKRLYRLAHGGELAEVPLVASQSVFVDNMTTDPSTGDLVLEMRSWTEPASFWRVTSKGTRVQPLSSSSAASSPFTVKVIELPARDGELIPVTIVQRAGVESPPKYVWVNVYGSYGFVRPPSFDPKRREFLERGGAYVMVHVRGGGEKGRRWHEAGRGENKIRTVYDFIDVVKGLRERGFGSSGGIMVHGGSAGGIPVGGLLAREPDLVDAVLIEAGIMNPARLEGASSIGDAQRDEFGTMTIPESAKHVRETDAFLNVKDGLAVPPTLLIAATNDIRVPCWQADKFVMRLQQATSTSNPILLRMTGGGHKSGLNADEESATAAEMVVFALSELHHPDFPPLASR